MSSALQAPWPAPDSETKAVPDAPIDYSVPYRSRVKGAARHFGFFPFFAKKPWPVVQEYIRHFSRPGDLVCDPFAGSGVAAVEALVLGRRAVASDINPVARFIARTTAISPVDLARLRRDYEEVRAAVQPALEELETLPDSEVISRLAELDYPRDPIPATVRRGSIETVDQLHTPHQLAGLAILRSAIERVNDPVSRDLLMVALAGTVRYANVTYILPSDKGKRRSPYRGDAGFLRRFSYSPATPERFYELPVWPTFERMFQRVIKAKDETNRLIGSRYDPINFVLADVPASRIHEVTGEGVVDYCFTDPPYSNEIYFLDLSTLWASWLRLEIKDEARHAELLIDSRRGKSRKFFEQEFAASMASISRALKPGHWLTLVYKHRDLSLWQTIVAACESNGLRYVNAVWQEIRLRSTRQIESPDINPKGDMYLNFRKISKAQFNALYPRAEVRPLPTRSNYVEHEVERLIVSYLGADISLIASGVIQQVLDSRAFRSYKEDPEGVTHDLEQVLKGSRFTTWQSPRGALLWVMAPGVQLDPSLDPTDRARYYLFDLLRQTTEVSEAEAARYLLERFSESGEHEPIRQGVRDMLRTVAVEVQPHRWRFDPERVTSYKQLRLFFRPSSADEIRRWLERRQAGPAEPQLRIDPEGFALLRERLEAANDSNPSFAKQYQRLVEVLQTVFWRLERRFGGVVDRVEAVGEWAEEGVDLRNLPYDDVVLDIILRTGQPSFSLYRKIAAEVFSELNDDDIFVQFQLKGSGSRRDSSFVSEGSDRAGTIGVPLFIRA